MESLRPYPSEEALFEAAHQTWRALSHDDWLEAFAAHPRIGDLDALRAKFASTADWAGREQGGVAGAADGGSAGPGRGESPLRGEVRLHLHRFATGKTAEAMLELLQSRLPNEPDDEIAIAADEQAAITRLRLEKIE